MFLLIALTECATITCKALEDRSKTEVCNKYKSLYVKKFKGTCHKKGSSTCALGTHASGDYTDAVNRINFYRYLCGLGPMKKSTQANIIKQENQACTIMQANNVFSHSLSSSLKCYTSGGATAASSSNIYWYSGTACAADSISCYMDDTGVDSLGHRRWLMLPSLSELAIGVNGHYSAVRVFGSGFIRKGTKKPVILAYPPPGPVPVDLIYKEWSFSRQFNNKNSNVHNMPSDTTVSIKCGSKAISIKSKKLYNENTAMYSGIIKFIPSRLPKAGETFTVTVSSKKAGTTWKYAVKAVSC